MTPAVLTAAFPPPPFSRREALRYAGCGADAGAEIEALLDAAVREVWDRLTYRVCYARLPVTVRGDMCDFGAFACTSAGLAKNLSGCGAVILFAATVGAGIDRLLTKYARLSPARALLLQGIGAERIEALCDAFCAAQAAAAGRALRPRFSPGYGDLALDVQKDIFALLDCERQLGLTLGDSLLMSPGKSVTAFAGIPRAADPQNGEIR